jgi:hypothetical protein
MIKTITLLTCLVGSWNYVCNAETGVVLKAFQAQDNGNVIVINLPGKDRLPVFQNGLPTTTMKVNVQPITPAVLEPYILKKLAAQAQKAMEDGDTEKAMELMRNIQGITSNTTPTAPPEPPEESDGKQKRKKYTGKGS